MHKQGKCTELIDRTANQLGDGVVALMLVAVQKNNMELSTKQAIERYVRMCTKTKMRRVCHRHRTHVIFQQGTVSTELVIKKCILAFGSLWVSNTLFRIAATERMLY
jgi:hypothetical protein